MDRFLNMSSRKTWIVGILLVTLCMSSCSGKDSNTDLGDYSSYLGDYSYNASISAMVYEDMEGETEGAGVQYRVVTDLSKLIASSPIPVCLYFYSGMSVDAGQTTAKIENMEEDYHDSILFVSIDAIQEEELVAEFSIEALPDFVIVDNGVVKASFASSDGQTWTDDELRDWVLENAGVS